jgi:flagellar biosynthesis protein FliP
MFAEHGGSNSTRLLASAVVLALFASAGAHAQPIIEPGNSDSAGDQRSLGETAIDNPIGIPDLSKVAPPASDGEGVSSTLQILVILTVLSLSPSIVILTTCFTRIVVVLAMLRQAMGTQQLPPAQIITGLALFLTFMVMAPTWQQVYNNALVPYLDKKVSQREAFERAVGPMREFMVRQIELAENEGGVFMLMEYRRGAPIPEDETLDWQDVPTSVLVPAYVLSELKAAFIMGFRFYLPFLVIDMVIATILISMGMLMLPPILISLPFKVALFVLANGWELVIGSLLTSFG